MALYRTIHVSFWNDTKVSDNFTPEDKYFMLYLLTNPYTNLIGCYEISIKQISRDIGYSVDGVESLIKRFVSLHGIIDYDFTNKELLVRNWHKYNWTKSPKLEKPLLSGLESIKTDRFRLEVAKILEVNNTVSIPYQYRIDTTVTVPATVSTSISLKEDLRESIKIIIEYLNLKLGTHYKYNSSKTQDLIKARFNDGFTLDDFQKVIDVKVEEWKNNDKMSKFLRPETLFSNKFEGYLNQKINIKKRMSEYMNEEYKKTGEVF